jgi:Na+/melibiose symporter-like transporter
MNALIAAAPALPLHTAGKYVAAAYVVFVAVMLIYVAIMASRQRHTERELVQLRRDLEARRAAEAQDDAPQIERVG